MSTNLPKWSRKCGRRAAGASALTAVLLLAGCGDPVPGGGGVIGPSPPGGALAFGAPTVLASNIDGLGAPVAAVDTAGLAAVLWPQPDANAPARLVVNARVNSATANWAATDLVEALTIDDGPNDAIAALQAAAPASGITALWLRQRPSAGDAVRSVTRDANAWTPLAVPLPPAVAASELALAANLDGVQAAAWVQDAGGTPQVVLSVRRPAVGGWSPTPIFMQTPGAPAGRQPAVAVDPAGVVLVVWRQGEPAGRLFSRTYDPVSDRPGLVLEVNPPVTLNDMRNPRALALDLNSYLVTWEQADGSGFYSLQSKTGTAFAWPGTAADVDRRFESASGSLLLTGPSQSAQALWQQAGTLFVARFALGQWSEPAQIGATLTGSSSDLRAAIDGAGNAIAVWLQRPAGGAVADLYAASLPPGVAPLAAQLLENDAADAAAPALAMNSSGTAVVAWRQAQATQTSPSLVARRLR